ncbi:MAG: hypothetical protein PVS2B2_08500 [Candidatus Acidiferrum sp.]
MNKNKLNLSANPPGLGTRARNIFVATLFAAVLLVPRLLQLRRNENTWMAFRIALGILGAALVILPLSLWNGLITAVIGLALFVASILIPSAPQSISLDDKARELGALVVVNGGKYQPGNVPAARVQLFVGSEHIWALDDHLQPWLVIPTAEISSARAEFSGKRWLLRVRWSDRMAELQYDGFFAEHLSRIAESTISAALPTAMPILPQRRAASA